MATSGEQAGIIEFNNHKQLSFTEYRQLLATLLSPVSKQRPEAQAVN